MTPINDNDLILFHYRDGLDDARIAEIDSAMAASAELRTRFDRLCRLLGEVDAEPVMPPAGFEKRLWAQLDQQLMQQPARDSRWSWIARLQSFLQPANFPRMAWASGFAVVLMIALGIGFFAGRSSAPGPIAAVPTNGPTMATRVLDSYVAGHLRATEALLMTAVNTDGGEMLGGNRELAAALVDSNRLYAVAAARSGNVRLADFLRQLEPVLLEVANQPGSTSVEDMQGLRDYLRKSDLLFQVRVTESRIDAASKRSL